MRIAMVSEFIGDARGFGQERVVRDSTALLRAAGHEVYFLAAKAFGEIQSDGSALFPELFRYNVLTPSRMAAGVRAAALHWLHEKRPDIVHLHDAPDADWLPSVIAEFPTVLSVHTVWATCPASGRFVPSGNPAYVCTERSGWQCLLHNGRQRCLSSFRTPVHSAHAILEYLRKRRALKNLKGLIAISRYAERTLVSDGWDAARVRVVYNPVSLPPAAPHSEARRVVCAARLVPMKGISVLLRAASVLSSRGIEATFEIAGEGPEQRGLEALAKELKLEERIRFHGALPFAEMQRLVASASVYVQPNLGPEGFGLSVAEASASGIPVVTSGVGALDEIVANGETGRVVPPGEPTALAMALEELLRQPERARAFGVAGRARVQKLFAPDAHRNALLSAYAELLR